MPRIKGSTSEVAKINKVIKFAGQCLAEAQATWICKENVFRTQFRIYFGNTTQAALEDIVYTMALMGGEIEGDNYGVEVAPPSGDENASVDHYTTPYGQARPQEKSSNDAIWKLNRRSNRSILTVRPLFLTAPFATVNEQSQVEIFLHELAHFAAGVIDYNPPDCYGMTGVNYCKSQSVDVAVRNAENVAMFLAWFRPSS